MKETLRDSSKSYFRYRLTVVLKAYFPHLAGNKPFIDRRADEAYCLYIELINTDVSYATAYELALNVLFDSLDKMDDNPDPF